MFWTSFVRFTHLHLLRHIYAAFLTPDLCNFSLSLSLVSPVVRDQAQSGVCEVRLFTAFRDQSPPASHLSPGHSALLTPPPSAVRRGRKTAAGKLWGQGGNRTAGELLIKTSSRSRFDCFSWALRLCSYSRCHNYTFMGVWVLPVVLCQPSSCHWDKWEC